MQFKEYVLYKVLLPVIKFTSIKSSCVIFVRNVFKYKRKRVFKTDKNVKIESHEASILRDTSCKKVKHKRHFVTFPRKVFFYCYFFTCIGKNG